VRRGTESMFGEGGFAEGGYLTERGSTHALVVSKRKETFGFSCVLWQRGNFRKQGKSLKKIRDN